MWEFLFFSYMLSKLLKSAVFKYTTVKGIISHKLPSIWVIKLYTSSFILDKHQ